MRNKIAMAALFLLASSGAHAHIMLAEQTAMPGARFTAQFKVGHGCSGAPTTALSIAIPQGVTGVEPAERPGWTLTRDRQGARIAAVRWEGGSVASDKTESFALAMTLPAREGQLAFPVTQICGTTEQQWNEVPAAGEKSKRPAPILTITAARKETLARVRDGWFRALPSSVPSGGYFTIDNSGAGSVILTGVQSPACGMVMMHKSSGGGMAHVPELAVGAGQSLAFAPGGYHLMCMNSTALMKPGTAVPVTLSFRDGRTVTASFQVRNAAGR